MANRLGSNPPVLLVSASADVVAFSSLFEDEEEEELLNRLLNTIEMLLRAGSELASSLSSLAILFMVLF
jgi:hypothetical protein